MTVADVDAVAKAFREGLANRDAAALASLYHDDARLLPPNTEPCEGRAAIQAALEQMLDLGVRSVDVEPIDVRAAGDMTIEYGHYTLVIAPGGAEAVTDVGKYVVVYETRQDGATKIALDIFNSNSPPAA